MNYKHFTHHPPQTSCSRPFAKRLRESFGPTFGWETFGKTFWPNLLQNVSGKVSVQLWAGKRLAKPYGQTFCPNLWLGNVWDTLWKRLMKPFAQTFSKRLWESFGQTFGWETFGKTFWPNLLQIVPGNPLPKPLAGKPLGKPIGQT